MYIIKSFFREFGKVILSLGVIGLLCLGVYSIVTESYKVGKDVQSKKTVVQTIAILDLQAENSNLKTQIIELDGNNYTLKILTQTQQEEIDTLKGTITSLNSSLTSLRNEKEATDEVVSNLQSDIAYLNEYVAELEAQLGGSKNILVVYLPEEMNSMKKIYSARLSDDIVLLSSNQYIDSKIAGFWAYSISNKTFTRVINQGCDYSEVIHLSDKISLIRSTYFGCLLSYNHETQVYTTLIDYRQQYIYVKHIDTERQVCVIESNSYVYIYKFNTEEMIMINDYNSLAGLDKVLYVKENYVYFNLKASGGNYYIVKIDLDNLTLEKISGGFFTYYYKLSDTKILSRGNNSVLKGLYLFDFETDTMTQIIEGYYYGDFVVMNGDLYCYSSDGYLLCVNLEDYSVTSIQKKTLVYNSSNNNKYLELENGFLTWCYSSSYNGLYYLPFDLSSMSTVLETGYDFVSVLNNNTLYISYSSSSLGYGIYTFDESSLTLTQVFGQGFGYDTCLDLGNSLLFYYSNTNASSSARVVLYNKLTNEYSVVANYYVKEQSYEDENCYIFLCRDGLLRINKADSTFETIISMPGLYEVGRLDNGNILFKNTQSAYEGVTFMLDITTYEFTSYSVDVELEEVA